MCHSPSGENQSPTLVTYGDVVGPIDATVRTVESQIYACKMPPPDQPQLTAVERHVILGWIVCGALDD